MESYHARILWGASRAPAPRGGDLLVEGAHVVAHAPRDAAYAAARVRGDGGDVVAVGDARLDEAAGLARELGVPEARGLELVAHAYARWGDGFVDRLLGDFAVVVVDARRGRVIAVRDFSGVKPLVYRAHGGGLWFSRDPADLVEIEGARAELDVESVVAFLGGPGTGRARTMFRGVLRLPPGHALVADAAGHHVRPFCDPPPVGRPGDPRANAERFGELLRQAVGDRLADGPLLVHASGGLDSSSIAALAVRDAGAAPFTLVRGAFVGAEEDPWAGDLARHLGRRIEIADGEPTGEIDDALDPSHPYRYPLAAADQGILRIARRDGAKAILQGVGGDELLFERGVYRDLARRARVVTLLRETLGAPLYSSRSGAFFLRDAVVSLAPRLVRRVRERVRRRAPMPWLRAPLPRSTGLPADASSARRRPSSATQAANWEWLTSPGLAATLETEERGARAGGMELRCPFLDRRLVAFVLALPFEERLPRGRMKALLRDAMGERLPRSLRERRAIVSYDEAIARALRAKKAAVRRVLEEGPWRSEPFVDRAAARELERASRASGRLDEATTVWDIVSLELWLRALR